MSPASMISGCHGSAPIRHPSTGEAETRRSLGPCCTNSLASWWVSGSMRDHLKHIRWGSYWQKYPVLTTGPHMFMFTYAHEWSAHIHSLHTNTYKISPSTNNHNKNQNQIKSRERREGLGCRCYSLLLFMSVSLVLSVDRHTQLIHERGHLHYVSSI